MSESISAAMVVDWGFLLLGELIWDKVTWINFPA